MAPTQEEEINFNPVIRLVFGIDNPDECDRVAISQRSKALRAIHTHYEQDPEGFAHNAEGKLFAYAKNVGGVAGLANQIKDEEAEPSDAPQPKPKPRHNPSDPEPTPANPDPDPEPADIGPLAVEEFARRTGGITTVDVKGVALTRNGLTVLLAREHNGRLVVLGSSSLDGHVEAVAAEAAARERPFMSSVLRGIVDTLETQAAPFDALPPTDEARRKYLQVKYQEPATNKKAKPGKVVLIRGGGIMMTCVGGTGVVSACRLREPIGCDVPLRIAAVDAIGIEQWLEGNKIASIWSEPGDAIDPATAESSDYQLVFRDAGRGRTQFLRFSKAGDLNVVDFRHEGYRPYWRAKVDTVWLQRLGGWANKWFDGLGQHNHIGRDNNAALSLRVSRDRFTVRWNRHSATEHFQFDAELYGEGDQETEYVSADLGPVLYRLSQVRLVGDLTMSGNAHALVVEYETAAGSFRIAIPTLNADGARDGALFEAVPA